MTTVNIKWWSTGSQRGLQGFLQLNEQQKENQGKGTPGAEWGRRPDEKGMENAKVLGSPQFLLMIPAIRNCRALRLEGSLDHEILTIVG